MKRGPITTPIPVLIRRFTGQPPGSSDYDRQRAWSHLTDEDLRQTTGKSAAGAREELRRRQGK